MAVVGIGTDLVEIKRIAASLERSDALMRRILTPAEQDEFAAHQSPAVFLAKRFAAKEACAKAFGTGIAQGLSFQHMQVNHNAAGRPEWQFTDHALVLLEQLGVQHAHLTISDEREHALAFVILET